MMYKHVRWSFNVTRWNPTREEWLRLTASISEPELTRINRFHFKDDSKSSLIGRALIRKFVSLALGVPSNQVQLDRSHLGRPVISRDCLEKLATQTNRPNSLDFNVSHSGDYCVLAGFWCQDQAKPSGSINLSVGVDVTKIVAKKSRPELDRFLDLMSRREFLPEEWDTVTAVDSERQKCINFTRLWCLKESFIKSIGLGLSYKLTRICFRPSEQSRYTLDPKKLTGSIISDTQVLIDNRPASDWIFLETALNEEHLVAIGYNYDPFIFSELDLLGTEVAFEELNIDSLIGAVTPIRSGGGDECDWTEFSQKASKVMIS